MYLPEGTYLKTEKTVQMDTGSRIILTFSGNKSFMLVEEPTMKEDELTVIPTNGEIDMFSDTIAVVDNSSITWSSDGVDYYMVSSDMSKEELEKRKCTVNEQDTTALIFSQKHLEALYLQCLMHRRNAMQEVPELKGLSETCNRIYKLQDIDVLFQCLLMDQMDWEEEKV